MPDRTKLLAEADRIIHKPNFTREDSARVEGLIRLANAVARSERPEPVELETTQGADR